MADGLGKTWTGRVTTALIGAVMAGVLVIGTLTTASAAPPPTTASVVAPDHATVITSGNKTTTFTLNLPAQAACSGDTANKGYHVYSYAVLDSAIGSNPATLSYDATNGPNRGVPLVLDGQSPYAAVNTAPNSGQIQQLPTFSFNAFTFSDFPPGLYDIGVACTKPDNTNSTDKYFNVQLQFAADPASAQGFLWTVAGSAPPPTTTTTLAGATTTTSSTIAGATTTSTTATPVAGGTTTTSTTVAVGTTTTSTTVDPNTTSTTSTTVRRTGTGTTTTSVAVRTTPTGSRPSGSSGLALTGGSVARLTTSALVLISLGGGAVYATWRRRRRASGHDVTS